MDINILPSLTPRYEDIKKEFDRSNAFAIDSPNANCTNVYNQVLYALVNLQTKEVIINPLKYGRTYRPTPAGFSEIFLCKDYLVNKYKRFRCSSSTSNENVYPEASEGYKKDYFTRDDTAGIGSKRARGPAAEETSETKKPKPEPTSRAYDEDNEFGDASQFVPPPPSPPQFIPVPDQRQLDACKKRVFIEHPLIEEKDKSGKILFQYYSPREVSRSQEADELIKHYGKKYQDVPFFDKKEVKQGAMTDCPADQNIPKLCSTRKDYIEQTRIFHPDKNIGCRDQAKRKFQTLEAVCNYEKWKACDVSKGGSMCRKSSKGQRRNKKYRKNHRTKKGVVGTRTRRRK